MFHKFYDDSYGKLIPIKSEVIVGDEGFKICGMVDQLFGIINNRITNMGLEN